jgi:NADP-dependent 3-hydroxy acid dehydrogenase YdfG
MRSKSSSMRATRAVSLAPQPAIAANEWSRHERTAVQRAEMRTIARDQRVAALMDGGRRRTLLVSAFGAFLVAQRAVPAMLGKASGAILFTGASASVKGYAESAPFAMGKFALRGLAQSMSRELSPKGIHVAHFVIDGQIRRRGDDDTGDSTLDPDAIAQTYVNVLMQPRSAWTSEVELRPWVERF